MRRTITALLLLLNGVGAAGRNLRPPCGTCRNREQRNRRRCKVAIVSASCRSLARNSPSRKSGYTVFGNEDNEVPVESWRVDDLVIAKISGALGNRAAVKRISYHKEAFASLETLKLFRDKIVDTRSEEHTSELQSPDHLVCPLLLEKKKKKR